MPGINNIFFENAYCDNFFEKPGVIKNLAELLLLYQFDE